MGIKHRSSALYESLAIASLLPSYGLALNHFHRFGVLLHIVKGLSIVYLLVQQVTFFKLAWIEQSSCFLLGNEHGMENI